MQKLCCLAGLFDRIPEYLTHSSHPMTPWMMDPHRPWTEGACLAAIVLLYKLFIIIVTFSMLTIANWLAYTDNCLSGGEFLEFKSKLKIYWLVRIRGS